MSISSRLIVLVTAFSLSAAEAVTKHYSFANGYPTTTTRSSTRATGASFGAGATVGTRSAAAKIVEEKPLSGKVTRVDSGDVIWVTPKGGKPTKIRLFDIDAPEMGQNFGVEAKKFLFDLVKGKDVTVCRYDFESEDPIQGIVMLQHEKGLVDVNLTMIQNGYAWYLKSKCKKAGKADASRMRAYADAESKARKAKTGLWSELRPTNPAEWRKAHYGDRKSKTS